MSESTNDNRAKIKELTQRAVRLLARREHTRAELLRKLAPHGTEDEIATVIGQLTQQGLQSDTRFAAAYVRSNAARHGQARLRQTLRTKGVETELINEQLANGDMADEATRAAALWRRKFGTPAADAKEWAKQARFLQARGFSSDIIRRLLRDPIGEDDA